MVFTLYLVRTSRSMKSILDNKFVSGVSPWVNFSSHQGRFRVNNQLLKTSYIYTQYLSSHTTFLKLRKIHNFWFLANLRNLEASFLPIKPN
jgi:hypothetical protein